jgi:hypothetical protein
MHRLRRLAAVGCRYLTEGRITQRCIGQIEQPRVRKVECFRTEFQFETFGKVGTT